MATSNRNAVVKICLVGDAQVGKTCLRDRYVTDMFHDVYTATLGAEFKTKALKIREEDTTLQIWDMAGEDKFRPAVRPYFRNCKAIIVVYDVTKKDSFKNVEYWLDMIRAKGKGDVPTILVANKCDVDNMRAVSAEKGKILAENNGFLFKEVSAKSGENVTELFSELAHQIEVEESVDDTRNGLVLLMPPEQRRRTAAFCLIS